MAKAKQAGKTRQQSPRPGKRLGVKKFGGEEVQTGMIIVRQRGTKFHPGNGVGLGKDHTLFAKKSGKVKFAEKFGKKYVHIVSQ